MLSLHLQALARKLQEEIEQLEQDRKLALEAQDRELAKMLYEKVVIYLRKTEIPFLRIC